MKRKKLREEGKWWAFQSGEEGDYADSCADRFPTAEERETKLSMLRTKQWKGSGDRKSHVVSRIVNLDPIILGLKLETAEV